MAEEIVKGLGTSWEIKPGVYQFRFNMGKDPETGKYRYSPKRTLHCVGKTKRGREAELRAAMEAYKQELNTGNAVAKTSRNTVGEYADRFHTLRKGTMGSELSYKREELEIRHIKELFGDCRLTDLRPAAIKEKYAKVRETGRFSESELHKIHTKLNQIMKEAMNDELIVRNPCEKISVPRPPSKERQALDASEAARLYECLVSEPLSACTVGTLLLLDTGMRRGEMLGLCWKCVDLEAGTIYIVQQYANDKTLRTPKSTSGRRLIHVSDNMKLILGEWQQVQTEYLEQIAMRPTEDMCVVNNDLGGFMDPNNFNRWFRQWCVDHGFGTYSEDVEYYTDAAGRKRQRKIGYQGLTPHMLRHTQATLLIGANTDIKTVQSRLGHSSVVLTLNTYSHAIAAKDAEAANMFSEVLRAEAPKKSD